MDTPQKIELPRLALFIIAVLGLLMPLVAVEVCLRMTGFKFHLYPEQVQFGFPRAEHFVSLYRTDKDRIWVRQTYLDELQKLKSEPPDLILMGDSCTEFGSYEQSLSAKIAANLTGKAINIAKVGHAGWSSFQGLQQLKLDVLPLKPKAITIYFGWNDHWKGFGVEDKNIAKMNSPLYLFFEPLRLVQLGQKALVAMTRGSQATLRRVSLADFKNNLSSMIDLARGQGIEPMLLTAPSSHRQGHEPKKLLRGWLDDLSELVPLHQSYVEGVREVGRNTNTSVCDLFAKFAELPTADLIKIYFKEDGIHLTKAGYDLLGGYLFDCLKKDNKSLFN